MAVTPLLIFLSAVSASADVFDGLVVMHFFDDLVDDSGNGHELVLGGNAYIFDDTLYLDGYGDYADIGPNTFGPVNPCGGNSDFTIAFQYYCDNEALGYGNGNGVIFDIGAEDSDTEFLALANNSNPAYDSHYVEIEDINTVGDESLINYIGGFITYDASDNLFILWGTDYYRCGGCCPGVTSYADDIIDYSADYSTYIPRLGSIHDANDYFNDIYTDFEGEIRYFAVWDRILTLNEMGQAACPPSFNPWPLYVNVSQENPSHYATGVKHDDVLLCFQAPEEANCIAEPNIDHPAWDPNNYLQGPFEYDVYFSDDEQLVADACDLVLIADDYIPANCNDVMCFDPCGSDLEPGTTYYWSADINDLNETDFRPGGNPVFYEGPIYSFTTWGFAENPDPEDNAENIDPGLITTLGWENDGYASGYNVYLYDDQQNLLESRTGELEPNTWDFTTQLGLSQTYLWRVDECNTAGCVEGPLWNFSTDICETLDDFESYDDTDDLGNTWKDWDNDTTTDNAVINNLVQGGGAQVYEGDQSMRVIYDKAYLDGSDIADDYTWREYTDLDLTAGGAKSIWIAYCADAATPPDPADEVMYLAIADDVNVARIDYPGDVCDADWSIFFIALSEISSAGADPCNVDEIRLGLYGPEGTPGDIARMYFDLLTRCGPICPFDYGYPDQVGGVFIPPFSALTADITGPQGPDCIIDEWEIGLLADQWLTDPNTDPNADMYIDHFVDFLDHAVIADQWLKQSLWPEGEK